MKLSHYQEFIDLHKLQDEDLQIQNDEEDYYEEGEPVEQEDGSEIMEGGSETIDRQDDSVIIEETSEQNDIDVIEIKKTQIIFTEDED